MSVTSKQLKVLRAIFTGDFGDHQGKPERVGQWVWANCINDAGEPSGIEGKALSGVVSTLAQAGLVECDGAGRDACVALTQAGYEAILAAGSPR